MKPWIVRLALVLGLVGGGYALAQQPTPTPEILQKKLAWEQREHQSCVETLVNFVQQYEDAKKQVDALQQQVKDLQEKQPKEEDKK